MAPDYDPTMYITRTNESLAAIVRGLDVKPNDVILAIAGCGDQAFALMEYAAKVVAVDSLPIQTEYMKKRLELLREGDYQGFLSADKYGIDDKFMDSRHEGESEANLKRRNQYFLQDGRLDKIREKSGSLEIRNSNIISIAQTEKGITKIYFSNMGYIYTIDSRDCIETLERIAANLPAGGLIYNSSENFEANLQESGLKLPNSWELDEELTKIARQLELEIGRWTPSIYRVLQRQIKGE